MPDQNTNPEQRPEQQPKQPNKYPVLESLFSDPKTTAELLQQAVNEGHIDAGALEASLKPYLDLARRGLQKQQKSVQDQWEVQREQLKTELFTKLINFNGDLNALKAILEPICKEHRLLLEPPPEAAINSEPIMTPDWISRDGQVAIELTKNSIKMLINIKDRWIPYNPR